MGERIIMNTVIRDLPKAIISWYPFAIDKKALFVSGDNSEDEVLLEVLETKIRSIEIVQCAAELIENQSVKYDYIIVNKALEHCENPVAFLTMLKQMLDRKGKLLIIAENRLAIKHFCGDKDPFTNNVLDGIDNYIMISPQRLKELGRAYSYHELDGFLSKSGFEYRSFFSIYPDIARPQMLIRDGFIPNEDLAGRLFPQYNNPDTVYLREECVYDTLCKNDLLHKMANGFFVECSLDGELTDGDQITLQPDRGRREAMATIVSEGKSVRKRPLYEEGMQKTQRLYDNTQYLQAHNVPVVEGVVNGDDFVTPFVNGIDATEYFRDLLRKDKDMFIREIFAFRKIIIDSSEHVDYNDVDWTRFEPGWETRKEDDPNIDKWKKIAFEDQDGRKNIGVILKRGYFDLVSLNCFHTDDGFVFFDQEFYEDNCPANMILFRTIVIIYGALDLERLLPRDELLKMLDLYEYRDIWWNISVHLMQKLRCEIELFDYHKKKRIDQATLTSNRFRMNYSQLEYEKLFCDIFKGIRNRKVFIFGSGKFATRFIQQYGAEIKIDGVIDNNSERWGEYLEGIKIASPEVLRSTDWPIKVFICIKTYESVLEQVYSYGVNNVSVFNPAIEYECPRKEVQITSFSDDKPKRYHIGYVAGVFDLFHMGHLNLLRRAKEQCDYLIVGVVPDELVISDKKTRPYVHFEERRAIVEACKYVDEAVRIPPDRPDTEDAWKMYHFDVQFSGSDYENDPVWHSKRTFLQKHGADMIFFPYTQSVSSTQLKKTISKNSR